MTLSANLCVLGVSALKLQSDQRRVAERTEMRRIFRQPPLRPSYELVNIPESKPVYSDSLESVIAKCEKAMWGPTQVVDSYSGGIYAREFLAKERKKIALEGHEILGHATLHMTKRYVHATNDLKQQAVEALGNLKKKLSTPAWRSQWRLSLPGFRNRCWNWLMN